MGYANSVSLKRLIKEVDSGSFDAVIHVGGRLISMYSSLPLSSVQQKRRVSKYMFYWKREICDEVKLVYSLRWSKLSFVNLCVIFCLLSNGLRARGLGKLRGDKLEIETRRECHQQESFSGLLSPGRSNHTNVGENYYQYSITRVGGGGLARSNYFFLG